MSSLNNALVGAVVSTLLTLSVLLSAGHALAFDRVENRLVQQLRVDDIASVMNHGPRLIIMWSLDCPACFEELDTIAKLLAKQPNLAISLVSTDDDPTRHEEINEVYNDPAFSSIPRWVYAPNQAKQLQHAIDSTWQGELPRSYYVDEKGKRHGHSGLLNEKQLKMIISLIE